MKIKEKNLEKWNSSNFTLEEFRILLKLETCEYERIWFRLKKKCGNKSDFRRFLNINSSGGYKNEFLEFLIKNEILVFDSTTNLNNVNVPYYYINKDKLWKIIKDTEFYDLFMDIIERHYFIIGKDNYEIRG